MNLQSALREVDNKGLTNYYFVRQAWIDSGSKMSLLPSMGTLLGLTHESFFADDWIVVEGNFNDE